MSGVTRKGAGASHVTQLSGQGKKMTLHTLWPCSFSGNKPKHTSMQASPWTETAIQSSSSWHAPDSSALRMLSYVQMRCDDTLQNSAHGRLRRMRTLQGVAQPACNAAAPGLHEGDCDGFSAFLLVFFPCSAKGQVQRLCNHPQELLSQIPLLVSTF